MKYFIFFLAFTLFTTSLIADDVKYKKRMAKLIEKMDKNKEQADWLKSANNFERVAKAEKTKWLPYYYASYCHTIRSFYEKDKKKMDEILETAMTYADKADKLDENNSETLTLKAMIIQMQITVNPMQRGQSYGMKASGFLDKAIKSNPENPRPYFMRAQSLLYTPEMYGGGKAKACPIFKKAADKFESFEPESDIHPNWGKEENKKQMESCSEE